jgi:hypothetical protein
LVQGILRNVDIAIIRLIISPGRCNIGHRIVNRLRFVSDKPILLLLEGHLAELNINPLMVLPSAQGVKATDALVVLRST